MDRTTSYRENLIAELSQGKTGVSLEGLDRAIELLSALGLEAVPPLETQRSLLRAQLLAKHQGLSWTHPARFQVSPSWRWAFIAFLLFLAGALVPIAAQEILSRLTIVEVDRIPEVIEVQPWQTNTDFRVEHLQEAVSLSELKAVVGFPIFVLSVLPSGCDFRASYLIREPENEIVLDYRCLKIYEKSSEGKLQYWTFARTGETQWLTINGEPALLVEGIWRFHEGMKRPVWDPNYLQLFFQREGVFIRFLVESQLGLDNLLKTAESMKVVG